MILGQSLERLMSRLNAGDGGGGGGGGGGVPAGASGVASGDPTSGGFGGTVAGGGLGGGTVGGGGGGIPAGASPVASGDPTSGGFGGTVIGGSVGEGNMGVGAAAALGSDVGEAVATGNMTADEGNAALAGIGENSGFMGQVAANTAAAMASIPSVVSTGFSTISPVPLTGLVTIGSTLAALSGQGMLGAEPETGTAEGGGGQDSLPAPASTVTEILRDLDTQGGVTMPDETQDILGTLREQLGITGGDSSNISFKVGNQEVSIMPKAQRDELALLLDYLRLQQSQEQFGQQLGLQRDQFGFTQRQAEPSFVDKSSQLIGLGSDALGLWQGVSSFF